MKNVVGIDISSEMIEYAKTKITNAIVCDAEKLCFENNTFDKAFAISILHHLENPEKGISEMSRVLRRDGKLVIVEPLKNIITSLPRKAAYKNREHFSELHTNFTKSELFNLVKKHFIVERIVHLGYIASPLLAIPDIVDFSKYIPKLEKSAEPLMYLDEIISKLPVIRNFSWGILIRLRNIG